MKNPTVKLYVQKEPRFKGDAGTTGNRSSRKDFKEHIKGLLNTPNTIDMFGREAKGVTYNIFEWQEFRNTYVNETLGNYCHAFLGIVKTYHAIYENTPGVRIAVGSIRRKDDTKPNSPTVSVACWVAAYSDSIFQFEMRMNNGAVFQAPPTLLMTDQKNTHQMESLGLVTLKPYSIDEVPLFEIEAVNNIIDIKPHNIKLAANASENTHKIVSMIANGYKNKEIVAELGVAASQVSRTRSKYFG